MTALERQSIMNDLGKTIAKHRKEHGLNQSQLAKELIDYNVHVKQNTVSAWESGITQPSARQLLAICEILDIYDVYTEFIGKNPINPFRNLNEEGMQKVMDYIHLLEKSGDYKRAEIIPLHLIRERKVFYTTVSAGTGSFLDGEDYEMYSSPEFQKNRLLVSMSAETVWSLATMTEILSGSSRPNSLKMAKSVFSTWMETLM